MTKKQAEKKYKKYLEGHTGNVVKALELLYKLEIPYVVDNIDKLRDIVKDHDKSKYKEPEWSAYLHHFYPTNDEESMMEEEFDTAVKHHISNNKHHWNYWIDDNNKLIKDIDKDEYLLYTVERICDWLAMAAQHDESATDYWDVNKDFVVQPKYARKLCDEIYSKIPKDFSKGMFKITRGKVDEAVLTEVKADDIVNDSKQSDPTRIKRSKNVKSSYIGMSKFGILNFKTTSETRNGYHYQTIEFKDLQPFWDIVEEGKEILGADIKGQLEKQDINVYCSDESFTWWAWYHKAYKKDYAYIDDKIPDLNNRLKAPKVNNISLRGGSCKHILSVLEYIKKPYVLMQIAQDMTNYLNGTVSVRDKQDVETAFQADSVKTWDREDVENYLGMSRDEVIAELRKVIQTDDSIDSVYDAIMLGLVDEKNLEKLDRELVAKKIETELDLDKELENLLGDTEGTLEDDMKKAMGESVEVHRGLKEGLWKRVSGGKGIITIDNYYNLIKTRILPIIRDFGFRLPDYPVEEQPGEVTYRGMQEDSKDILYFEFSSQYSNKEIDSGSRSNLGFMIYFKDKKTEDFTLDLNDSAQIKNTIGLALDSIGYDPYHEEKTENEEEQKKIQAELDKRKKWKAEEEEREEELAKEPEPQEPEDTGPEFPDLMKPMKMKKKRENNKDLLSDVADIEQINSMEEFKKAFVRDLGDIVGTTNPIVFTDQTTGDFIAIYKDTAYEIDKNTGRWKKSPVKW